MKVKLLLKIKMVLYQVYLIYNYMNEKNINNLNSIISEVKKKKNEINNEILKNINNEQLIYLILILTKLHEELNINQLPDSNYLRRDFNEINCLNSFMQNYKKNKSIIQDIFFGIEESIIICNICGLSQYFFDIYKLIYFELKKEQQPFNLQNSILEWENHLIPTKYDCPKCKTLTVLPIIKKILNLSDILIIAIINKDKVIIDFKTIIRTSSFEYKLLSFINDNGNNFDVIYYSETKFYTINNENNIEEIKDNQVNLNPNILFYEKVNTIEPTNINNMNNNNNIKTNNSEFNQLINNNLNNNIANEVTSKKMIINDNKITNNNSVNNIQNNNDIQSMNNQNNSCKTDITNGVISTNYINNNTNYNFKNNIINYYNLGIINKNINDIQNMNNQNNYDSSNIKNNEENNKEITLIFELSESGKVLYLDTKESFSFKNIIEELKKKYLWLKDVEIIDYTLNGIKISENKTVKENGLTNDSTIIIKEK